jgi:hypothetical protein
MAGKEPRFALEAGIAVLRWLLQGYGCEITSLDIRQAYDCTVNAAAHAGCASETLQRLSDLVAKENQQERFVSRALEHGLGLKSIKKD